MKSDKPLQPEINQKPQAPEGMLPSQPEKGDNLPGLSGGILVNTRDVYNSRYILSKDLPASAEIFESQLTATLAQFREEKVKGVFLELDISQVSLISVAAKHGFTFHHTLDDLLTMQAWIPSGKNRLPAYATHYVGVGGLTIDFKTGQVLVIKEKQGNDTFSWKIPGGLVDSGEYVGEAAVREVREETGIESEFKGVITLREKKNYNFGRNDIYFICLLEPLNTTIDMCQVEVAKCKWISIEEWKQQEFLVETQKLICDIADDLIAAYKNKSDAQTHLPNVLYSREVSINLPTLKANHVMYVPSQYTKQA
jgi:ADP-ribose pyrophosphatase YjhB (NUDIX family)